MRNYDLIKSFVGGATSGKGSNLKIEGNDLINYWTVIATRRGGIVVLNNHGFSPTTAKNQSYVRGHATKLIECEDERFSRAVSDSSEMTNLLDAFESMPGVSYMSIW